MQIDWWTLALQAVNFVVLVWLLQRFLYRPVKAVIAKRKALADEAFAQAAKRESDADAARQRYEADRAALATERQDLLKKVHHELEAERDKMLEQARQEANALLGQARQSVASERDAALAGIREQVAGLAAEMASELLRKTGPDVPSAAFLAQFDQQLKALPDAERARLQNDLGADGAMLTVVTAAPLAPDDQAAWKAQLAAGLGVNPNTQFTSDPAILGGAELRFPHAVLGFTWRDQLDKAKELLGKDDAAA